MCTLIVRFQVHADAPVVVAANRDELLTRPAGPPARLVHRGTVIVAPRDLEAGGTWLGVNQAGVFVGITNRFGVEKNRHARSRGQLVLDALAKLTARDAFAAASHLDPTAESGFHLLMADRDSAHLVTCDRTQLEARTLEPGTQVVTERSFGAGVTTREASITGWLENELPRLAPSPAQAPLDALGQLLSRHADDGFEGVCVHVPAHGYGTRSSSLIALNADGTITYRHAPGPPCTTPYGEVPADAWLVP